MQTDAKFPVPANQKNLQSVIGQITFWIDLVRPLSVKVLFSLVALLVTGSAHATETLAWGPAGTVIADANPHVATVGGTTVTTTTSYSGTAATWEVFPVVEIRSTAFNGVTPHVRMDMDAALGAVSPYMQVTFSFSRPVTALSFTIADVDGGPDHTWNDLVEITSVPAPGLTAQAPGTSAVGTGITWSTSGATGTAQANTNAGESDPAISNMTINFASAVSSVTVRYIAAPVSADNGNDGPNQQAIGIGNLTWSSGAVRVQKITSGGVGGPFAFTQTNLLTTPADITTTIANTVTPASPAAHEISAPGTNVTITEPLLSGWSLTTATCTDANSAVTGNTGPFGSLSGNTVTLDSSSLVLSGSNITCAFTNSFLPQSFGTCPVDAYITRGATATTVRLYTLGLADGAMTDQGTSAALADMVNGIGFRQQDGYIWGWGNGATVRRLVRIGVGGVADVPYASAPAGLPAAPQFYSADVSPAGIYTGVIDNQLWFINVATNTLAGPPVTLASSDIGTDIAYHPTDGNLYTVRSSSGEVVRINPSTGAVTPIGISLPNGAPGGFGGVFFDNQGTLYAYKSNSPGGTGLVYRVFNVDGSGTLAYDLLSASLTATSLDGARCPTAPPQGAPAIILRKTTTGGFSGPFAFAINNTVDTSGTVTTTVAGTPVQVDGDDSTPGVQPFTVETAALGQSLTINEANLPTGWGLTGATCRVDGNAVGSLTDNTYTIPGASVVTGALFECDFTNALRQTDIQVVKTASPNPVVSSDVVTYQIVVTNNGPLAADGAVLTDVAGVGQDCTMPSTTATCTATGGATCPSPVPVGSLLGTGITIPTLPVGGQVTIGLQCTVSASGTP